MGAEHDLWSGSMRLFDYVCPPTDPAWQHETSTGDHFVVAFPGTAVRIAMTGQEEILADATVVTLYAPHQHYRRRLVDPDGDRCSAVGLAADTMRELVGFADPQAADHGEPRLPGSWAPLPAAALMRQRRLVSRLRREPTLDALTVEEEIGAVVGAGLVARAGLDTLRMPVAVTPAARRARQRLVDDTKQVLVDELTAPLTLADVGRRVMSSPFHLARVFRAATGMSLHGYRTRLRLAVALEAVVASDEPLATIAVRTGFASHSHLTDAFRSAYGVTPSAARS